MGCPEPFNLRYVIDANAKKEQDRIDAEAKEKSDKAEADAKTS